MEETEGEYVLLVAKLEPPVEAVNQATVEVKHPEGVAVSVTEPGPHLDAGTVTSVLSITVIFKDAVVEPQPLVAVTVYDVNDETTVGVPLITPVLVFIESPEGKEGEIE